MENILVELYCDIPFFFLAITLLVYIFTNQESTREKWYISLIIAVTFGLVCIEFANLFISNYYTEEINSLAKEYGGYNNIFKNTGIYVINYVPLKNFLSILGYVFRGAVFMLFWLLIRNDKNKNKTIIHIIPFFICFLIIATSPLTKWVFYFDNVFYFFHTGSLYYIVYFSPIFYAALIIYEVIVRYTKKAYKDIPFLVIMLIFLVGGAIIESYFYDESRGHILNTLIMASCVMYYLFLKKRTLNDLIETKSNELKIKENELMLSQIKPHFIFNSLNSILDLCEPNSEEYKALIDFAKYLRFNIDSTSTINVVPFNKELEHVKIYVDLEKRRFKDKLNVFYKIEYDKFEIPVLSIQPIVENAIKYSILGNGVANVVISTYKFENYILIEILDDGPGFDVNNIKDGHTGINNVKFRLKEVSGAELTISSIQNKGTVVKIKLPRQ